MPEGPSCSIVNLGGLSKPADTLIKKVSQAVGGIFAPHQIKRIAKAEAEAALIQAQAEIQITDLRRRAMLRFVDEEARRQKNIEDITNKALPQLKDGADPDRMEDDWVTNFFEKSRMVSDEDMQNLWSRVLAGEANTPGTYSKRTVNFLSGLDKVDAQAFSKFCGFVWQIGKIEPLIFDMNADIYNKQGADFASLVHLESIGLIRLEAVIGFQKTGCLRRFSWQYYGKPLQIEMSKDSDNAIDIGHALFTRVGRELAPISGSAPVEGFFEYVRDILPKQLHRPKII